MARVTEKDRVGVWQSRVDAANKVYDEWEQEFRVRDLEAYYAGKQWREETDRKDNYTINMIFPTIEIKLPSLMFNRPTAHFKVKPARANDVGSHLDMRAHFLEDVANHFVLSPTTGFREETLLCTKESFYRFGVIEVGYSANFADNPQAGKPVLSETSNQPLQDANGQAVLAPDYIIEDELIYVKRIPGKCFRTPAIAKNRLDRNDWCGYFEWTWASDIRRNKFYNNRLKIKANGQIDDRYKSKHSGADEDPEQKEGMVKVWKVWDQRRKMRHVFVEGADFFLIEDEPYKYLPFADLKFYELLDQYYPLPYVSQLLSPQDELNETRTMQRVHRRRFARRYEVRVNSVDEDELAKLEGPAVDGQYIMVNQNGAIQPIPDAALDRSVAMNVPSTKEDFMMISSVGGEQRAVPDADTATQANIINQSFQTRNSFEREIIARFLSKVIELIVKTARDRMTLPWYMKTMVDPKSMGAAQEAALVGMLWQEITSNDIGELEFEVQIEVESLAPDSEDKRRERWLQVLSLLGNPTMMLVMANSDMLLRKTLAFYGIKSDREIGEIRTAMQNLIMMQMAMGAAGPGDGANPDGPSQTKNAVDSKTRGGPPQPKP